MSNLSKLVGEIKKQPLMEQRINEAKHKIDALKAAMKDKDELVMKVINERSNYIQALNAAEMELKKKKHNLQPRLAELLNKCQVIEEEKQVLRREMDHQLMAFEKLLRELGANP